MPGLPGQNHDIDYVAVAIPGRGAQLERPRSQGAVHGDSGDRSSGSNAAAGVLRGAVVSLVVEQSARDGDAGASSAGDHVEARAGARHMGAVRTAEAVVGDVDGAAIGGGAAVVHSGVVEGGAAKGGALRDAVRTGDRGVRAEGGAGARGVARRRRGRQSRPAAGIEGAASEAV